MSVGKPIQSSPLLQPKSKDSQAEQRDDGKDKEEDKDQETAEENGCSNGNGLSPEQPQGAVRRAVPREKRRHHTVSGSRPLSHTPASSFPSMVRRAAFTRHPFDSTIFFFGFSTRN